MVPNRDKTKFLSHKRVFASLTHSPTNTGKVTVYTSEVQGDFKRFISIYKKTLLINLWILYIFKSLKMKRYPLINDYLLYLSQNIPIRKLQIMISWQMSVAEICTRSWP